VESSNVKSLKVHRLYESMHNRQIPDKFCRRCTWDKVAVCRIHWIEPSQKLAISKLSSVSSSLPPGLRVEADPLQLSSINCNIVVVQFGDADSKSALTKSQDTRQPVLRIWSPPGGYGDPGSDLKVTLLSVKPDKNIRSSKFILRCYWLMP